ncbi:MAG: two-component system response regulator [Pseudanabaena sp.]|nr:MAG: two-component system response regulator [Pseudanabaena sp.]
MITILVVEDTTSERELICEYLRQGGYSVVSANNGSEGLAKFVATNPNVVITDLVMPGISGLELCRAVKKSSINKVPVIACTSKNQELDRLWGMKQGVDVYLTKPFSKDDILQAVRSLNVRG